MKNNLCGVWFRAGLSENYRKDGWEKRTGPAWAAGEAELMVGRKRF
jgi:hypothetical protein